MGAVGGDLGGDIDSGGGVADDDDFFVGVLFGTAVEFRVTYGAWVGFAEGFDAFDFVDVGDVEVAVGDYYGVEVVFHDICVFALCDGLSLDGPFARSFLM